MALARSLLCIRFMRKRGAHYFICAILCLGSIQLKADPWDPTIIERLQEFARFMRPSVGTSERLRDIGLSGRIWKLRSVGTCDCAINTINMIGRFEFMERNFDPNQAYADYLKGYFFDPNERQAPDINNYGDHYLYPMTPEEFFGPEKGRWDFSTRAVFVPANRYRRMMFMRGGTPPYWVGQIASPYNQRRVPRGISVLNVPTIIEASTTLRESLRPNGSCGVTFKQATR